ncbi:MAG TPA: hypothetical protein PLR99_08180, partial [Polyangiaceae bacterium]|nr:hypothetical protein [Polyangiaceae bacterium]
MAPPPPDGCFGGDGTTPPDDGCFGAAGIPEPASGARSFCSLDGGDGAGAMRWVCRRGSSCACPWWAGGADAAIGGGAIDAGR